MNILTFPLNVYVLAIVETVTPLHVIILFVIAEPPVSVGGENETVAWPLPRTALKLVGALGKPAGVAVADPDADEVPVAFVAVAVNV